MANLATISNNILADSGIDPLDLIVGTGTVNYVPKFTAEGTIANSLIYDNGTYVGINTTSVTANLTIAGTTRHERIYAYGNYSANFLNSGAETFTWFKLGNAFPFSQTRIYYRAGSSNSEEEGEFKVSNTCDKAFIEWTRNTYSYHIREIKAIVVTSCGSCEIWALIRHAGSFLGTYTNFQWQIHSGTDSGFVASNTTGTPGSGHSQESINSTDGYFYANSDNMSIAERIGVGTTAPSAKLHIDSALGSDVIRISDGLGNVRFAIGQEAAYAGNYINTRNIDMKLQTYLSSGSGGNIIFQTQNDGTSSVVDRMRISPSGSIKFNAYGAGTFTGTVAYNLAVDSSGNIIEVVDGGGTVTGTGTANQITYWTGASTIAALSTATYPSLTELSYVKGVTSAIQTQINSKQATLTLTTTGTSGAATLVGATLNIPQYQSVITNPVTGTGSAGQVAYWSSSSAITSESNLFWDATNNRLGIGTDTPTVPLDVYLSGTTLSNSNVRVYRTQDANNAVGKGIDVYLTTNGSPEDQILYGIYIDSFVTGGLRNTTYSIYTNRGDAVIGATSGALGVGTVSPSYKLDVRSITTDAVAFFGYSQTSSASNGLIKLNSGRIPQSGSDFTGESGIIFGHSGGTGGVNYDGQGGYIKSIRLNTYATAAQADSALVFATSLDNSDYERMRINSIGDVGIGKTEPYGRLHIQGIYNGAQNTLNLENNWPNTHKTSAIRFWAYYNSTNPLAVIQGGEDESATNAGQITFSTMLSGAAPLERMRISPDGYVGINTNSPNRTLTLVGTFRHERIYAYGNYTANFSNTVPTTNTWFKLGNASPFSQTKIYYRAGSGTSEEEGEIIVSNTCSLPFIQWTRNTYNLHISEVRARMVSGCGACEIWVLMKHGDYYGGSVSNFQWQINGGTDYSFVVANTTGTPGTGTNEKSIVSTDGYFYANSDNMSIANRIGVGTTAPSQPLHVAGNVRVTGAYYDSNNSAGTSGQVLSSTGTGTDWVSLSEITGVDGTGTANYIAKWQDANTIQNSIIYDNGTNVGIGTNAPGAKLQVEGNGIVINTEGSPAAKLLYFRYSDGAAVQSDSYLTFNTGGSPSEKVRITDIGNVGMGTQAPQSRLDVITAVSGYASFGRGIAIGEWTGIHFGYREDNANYRKSAIVFERKDSSARGTIHILNNNDADISSATLANSRVAITSDGLVGVGVIAPAAQLQVAAASQPVVALNVTASITTASRGDYAWYNSAISTVALIRATAVTDNVGTQLEFHTRPAAGSLTQTMTLKTSGQLQINSYTSSSSFTGTAAGVLAFDSSGNIITQSATLYPSGSGTTNYITKWTGANTVGNSQVFDNGTNVTISGTDGGSRLSVYSGVGATGRVFEAYYGSGANLPFNIGINRSSGNAWIGWNAYQSTGDTQVYQLANRAARITSYGDFVFQVAGDGTANAAITWTGAMHLTNGGYLGIGATPSYRLTVNESITNPIAYFGTPPLNASSRNALIILQSGTIPQSGSDTTGEVGFLFKHSYGTGGVSGTANGGYIESIRESVFGITAQVNTALVFGTSSGNTDGEKMRISSGGVVGIGISSSFGADRLDVYNSGTYSSGTTLRAYRAQDNNSTVGYALRAIATTTGSPDGQTIYGAYVDSFNGGGATNLTTYGLYVNRGRSYFGDNVGIGRTDPYGRLHIQGIYNGAQNTLNLENNWPNTHRTSLIRFWAYYNADNPQAIIEGGQDESATNAGQIVFKTMLAGAAPAERMRISPDGYVGINTNSPNRYLTVVGTTRHERVYGYGNNFLSITNSVSFGTVWVHLGTCGAFTTDKIYYRVATNTSEEEGEITVSNTCSLPFIQWQRNTYNPMVVQVRARMTGGCGQCQIWMQIRYGSDFGGAATNFNWQAYNGTDSGFAVVNAIGTPGTGTNEKSISSTDGYFYANSGSIAVADNIAIGTTAPSAKLHIDSALGNDAIRISDTTGSVRMSIGQEASYQGNYINTRNIDMKLQTYLAGGSGGNIIFQTQNSGSTTVTERMRVTPAGEIWMGYTSDQGAYLLQVNGSVYASAYFESSDVRLKQILNKHEGLDFGAIEYRWADARDNKLHWGYSAQEVMKFLPDAVNENNDGFLTLDYNQAHTYKIAMLEKRIAELEKQLKNK